MSFSPDKRCSICNAFLTYKVPQGLRNYCILCGDEDIQPVPVQYRAFDTTGLFLIPEITLGDERLPDILHITRKRVDEGMTKDQARLHVQHMRDALLTRGDTLRGQQKIAESMITQEGGQSRKPSYCLKMRFTGELLARVIYTEQAD